MGQEAKTGRFVHHQQFRVGLPPETKEVIESKMLSEVGSRLAHIAQDGREYALTLRVGEWHEEESHQFGVVEALRVEADLVLLRVMDAEVGEWVRDIGSPVGDGQRAVFGEGYGELAGRVFERGDIGWRRVE